MRTRVGDTYVGEGGWGKIGFTSLGLGTYGDELHVMRRAWGGREGEQSGNASFRTRLREGRHLGGVVLLGS